MYKYIVHHLQNQANEKIEDAKKLEEEFENSKKGLGKTTEIGSTLVPTQLIEQTIASEIKNLQNTMFEKVSDKSLTDAQSDENVEVQGSEVENMRQSKKTEIPLQNSRIDTLEPAVYPSVRTSYVSMKTEEINEPKALQLKEDTPKKMLDPKARFQSAFMLTVMSKGS